MTAVRIRDAVLVASGDLRETANRLGWPAQVELERNVEAAFARHGVTVRRGHPVDASTGHGFLSSQRMGMDVFASIDRDAPIVVAEAVWQYSHHVLAGLRRHRGPILTVANWSGEWPGPRRDAQHQRLADEDGPCLQHDLERGPDRRLRRRRHRALDRRRARSSTTRRTSATSTPSRLDPDAAALGRRLAGELAAGMAILGVFDEGCMGMYNAIFDDELPQPDGHLQGAAQPVRARRRDAPGRRRARPGPPIAGCWTGA